MVVMATFLLGTVARASIIDNGGAGYSETGAGWGTWQGEGEYGSNFRYASSAGNTATWAFSGLANGIYDVYGTWPGSASRTAAAPYSFSDSLASTAVNQKVAPASDFTAGGSAFQKLGSVHVVDGTFDVTLNSVATLQVIADAMALEAVDAYIIDDGDPGFSKTGTWGKAGASYYVNDGGAAASASWNFTGLANETYAIYATWPEQGNRSTEAPYTFSDGVLPTTVNQRNAPNGGYVSAGVSFQEIGVVTVADGNFTVTLTDDTSTNALTFVMANAMALKVVSTASTNSYENWAQHQGLSGAETNRTADIENGGLGDGMNNLVEYALGGNPSVDDAAAVLPKTAVVTTGGTNWFYHIHNQRTDDASLTYTVQLSTNLVSGTWQTNDVEKVGESGAVNNFKSVTNRTDAGSKEFMRLRIGQN